ncbi:MAG: ATP-binding cassette domain-containing protein [Pseudomonadota bacterium]
MIVFQDVWKAFGAAPPIARGISLALPSSLSLGLLGRNGAGKSTLLKLIAGTLPPDRGRITAPGPVSWPVGFQGAFHPDLTGAQNIRFVARLYGVDTGALARFVSDFAELGPAFHAPLRSYSTGMRARLAFGASMALPFSTYLIDEVTSVGDGAFRERASALLKARLKAAGAIIVSHSMGQIRDLCEAVAVLEEGQLLYFSSVEAGIAHHERSLAAAS